MRVALIGPVPPSMGGMTPGGVATHQAHLAAGLAQCPELDVSLMATNARSLRQATPYQAFALSRPGLSLIRRVGINRSFRIVMDVKTARQDGSRRELLEQLLCYAGYLSTVEPDVVHVQHPLERADRVLRVKRLERGRWPVVITAHSLFGEHTDETIHTTMAPNLRAADRVIAVSPHIADQASSLGVDAARIRVIRSGIEVERFRPRDRAQARAALGFSASAPLVLFVGNLEPRKQLDVLLHALARLRTLDCQAALVIVGTGENAGVLDQTDRLQALSHELGLDEAVRFVGHVDDQSLPNWYAAADVFALPSSSEAQGIVALEAMACGLPVVASAVGGLLGTIDDGQDGFLVPSGEVEPLAQRLHMLLTDRALRERSGAAARTKVTRDFTWQRAVAATVEVYREVAACHAI